MHLRPKVIDTKDWPHTGNIFSRYKDHLITSDFNLHCEDFGNGPDGPESSDRKDDVARMSVLIEKT